MSEHADAPEVTPAPAQPEHASESEHAAAAEPAGAVEHPAPAEHAAAAEHDHTLSDEHKRPTASQLDRAFGHSVLLGYIAGIVAIFGIMFAMLSYAAPDIPLGAKLGAAAGVALWIGIMGGVVAVGMWARKHEHDIFH
jgi:uncharacterized membrane protein